MLLLKTLGSFVMLMHFANAGVVAESDMVQSHPLLGHDLVRPAGGEGSSKLIKRAIRWRANAVDGAITTFLGAFTVGGGVWVNACSDEVMKLFGYEPEEDKHDNMKACAVSGAVLGISFWMSSTLSGMAKDAWVYKYNMKSHTDVPYGVLMFLALLSIITSQVLLKYIQSYRS